VKRRVTVPASVFILLFLCIAVAGAGEVTFSTEQSDYLVQAGQEAVIPLAIGNTYGHDVTGTLTVVSSTSPGPVNGTAQAVTNETRQKTYTVFSGTTNTTIGSGVIDKPSLRTLSLVFRFDEGGTRTVTLGPVTVHYETTPQPVPGQKPVPIRSTDQTVTPKQQAGPPGSGGPGSPAAGGPTGTANAGQGTTTWQSPVDSGALKSQVSRNITQASATSEKLSRQVASDPLVKSIDEDLYSKGFRQGERSLQPINDTSGRSSWSYRSENGSYAVLSADLTDGNVTNVAVNSDDRSVLPEKLKSDPSFQDQARRIEEKGFRPETYQVTGGQDDGSVQVLYRNAENRTALLTASLQGGNVSDTRVKEELDLKMIVFAFLAALSPAVIALVAYRLNKRHKKTVSIQVKDQDPAIGQSPEGYRTIVSELLVSARTAYGSGNYAAAFGTAGQAVRTFYSNRYSDGSEQTDSGILSMLGENREKREAGRVLSICSEVRFSRGIPADTEFLEVTTYIERLLDLNEKD
jgi:hypothetical protein